MIGFDEFDPPEDGNAARIARDEATTFTDAARTAALRREMSGAARENADWEDTLDGSDEGAPEMRDD